MSYADRVFRRNREDILKNGVWDTELAVRPRWEDGTPAHTVKKFGIVNRYDLQREFPILTLRRTYWKSAVDELLWIWQKRAITSTSFLPHLGCMGGRERQHRQGLRLPARREAPI